MLHTSGWKIDVEHYYMDFFLLIKHLNEPELLFFSGVHDRNIFILCSLCALRHINEYKGWIIEMLASCVK